MSTAIDYDTAAATVARVVAEARAQGVAVAVAVTDTGGHVVAAGRMDGIGFVSAEAARRKAVTAASFGAPTAAVAAMVEGDPALVAALRSAPELELLPGGFPLQVDGVTVGGVGIAGGHYSKDQTLGENALPTP
jgi:uncharacterized protein GlcG (DUF336 family)